MVKKCSVFGYKRGFLEALADWLEKWHDDCPAFTLTSKTSYALVLTLRAQSRLIKELLSEGYDFVMTSRLQSNPIERKFSQYRQMSAEWWEVFGKPSGSDKFGENNSLPLPCEGRH